MSTTQPKLNQKIEVPVCKCGEPMKRSRRASLKIDGWICAGMIHDLITKTFGEAINNHSRPIQIDFKE